MLENISTFFISFLDQKDFWAVQQEKVWVMAYFTFPLAMDLASVSAKGLVN